MLNLIKQTIKENKAINVKKTLRKFLAFLAFLAKLGFWQKRGFPINKRVIAKDPLKLNNLIRTCLISLNSVLYIIFNH